MIGYNVYHAPDGKAPSYLGRVSSLRAARHLAATGAAGLPEYLWSTARAAGHCAGIAAPSGREADEPKAWYKGDYCAVAVMAEE